MSREHKYRGWDTRKNVMYSAEELGRDQLTLSVDGRGFINVHGKSTERNTFPTHIIPLQYTGLKDKDGVEIYEDDIFKSLGQIGIVKKKEGCWIVDWPKMLAPLIEKLYPHIKEGKVIGNIHQNPKLLEQAAIAKGTEPTVERTAPHGQSETFQSLCDKSKNPIPLDSAFPEHQHSTYADDEPIGEPETKSTTTIEDIVGVLDFKCLSLVANILHMSFDCTKWHDDEWPANEDALRVAVAEAMEKIGSEL